MGGKIEQNWRLQGIIQKQTIREHAKYSFTNPVAQCQARIIQLLSIYHRIWHYGILRQILSQKLGVWCVECIDFRVIVGTSNVFGKYGLSSV
jgi:hypothetical protein